MSIRAYAVLLSLFLFAASLSAEPIPFEICAESTTWVRPSPEVQAKIWNDGRCKDFARTAYAWTHNFLVVLDPESTNESGYLRNLSGLWTREPEIVNPNCNASRSGYEWIEVWSLLHRVKEVRRDANTYTVIAEAVDKGFQSVFIRRLTRRALLRFVTPVGWELERWDESPPPRQFNNAVRPGAIIRAPNGQIIRK